MKYELKLFQALLVTVFLVTVLWLNEWRFDVGRSAADAQAISSAGEASDGDTIAITGGMSPETKVPGEYCNSFKGYLLVQRHAQIRSWHVIGESSQELKWDTTVGTSNRNGYEGLKRRQRRLSSKRMVARLYEVSDLTVDGRSLEIVVSDEQMQPINLTDPSVSLRTRKTIHNPSGNTEYLYFPRDKELAQGLGDERVNYEGIPVPAQVTYFGRLTDGKGSAQNNSNQLTFWINYILQDHGELHHIVSGDRNSAIATLRKSEKRKKWLYRLGATFGLMVVFVFVKFSPTFKH